MNFLQHITTACALVLIGHTSIAQRNTVSAGGEAMGSGGTVSFSVGQLDYITASGSGGSAQQGVQHVPVVRVRANIIAMLQGPYDPGSGLMTDGLRANGLIPLNEPYTAMGFPTVEGGGESTTAAVFTTTGDDAIIDWVHVQLRDDDNLVIATRNALLQADGDIVDTDGTSPVRFAAKADDYRIAVMHRNHLSIISFNSIALTGAPATVNFSNGDVATYGSNAQAMEPGTFALWCGDVSGDDQVKYTGENNDRDFILQAIGGVIPTNTAAGYLSEDVNMDGTVMYTGADNDRDLVLMVIGGVVPTNTRAAQMP
ncbi:MAG TPA: hypothetical protein PLB89_02300 [Flavobacteriales bacterium]|nr:hypothetical protein [Flavobacteriales bacterium]